MKRFGLDILLSAVLLPPILWAITWLSGHDYLTWEWYLILWGVATVLDVVKLLWRRRKELK